MTNHTSDDNEWLMLLQYDEPSINWIDPDVVIRRARRLRLVRRGGSALAALVVAAAATAVTTHFVIPDRPKTQSAASPLATDSFLKQHPPIGPIAYVDKPNSDWVVAVWVTSRGEICRASFRGRPPTNLDQSCPSAPPNLLTDPTPGFVEPRMFFATPPDSDGTAAVVGVVRGPAEIVAAQAFGRDVAASVQTISSSSGPPLGAYVLWIPTRGHSSYGDADITDLVAKNSSDEIIARAGA